MTQPTHALPTQHYVPTTERTFASLGVSAEVCASLDAVGFAQATPIQAEVIPPATAGRDLIGCAQTGTGKTAAYVIPLAERLQHGEGVRGLILCPTRELALQIQAFIELFGENHHLTSAVLIGGVRINPQIKALQAKPDVIVATPGRLFDHLERKTVKLDAVSELVFDEADRMLDMGFLPQIDAIMRYVPKQRHTMMFSATMPPVVERLSRRYLADPLRITIAPSGTTAVGIEHRLYLVEPGLRFKLLRALLEAVPGSTLIFVRMREDAEWTAKALEAQAGIVAERLHSDRNQKERQEALEAFRDGRSRILVATDIAARGLDVPHIAHVIHYDLPEQPEDYVHRAGRTARFDATGISSAIGSWMDKPKIDAIEQLVGHPLPRCEMMGIPPWEDRPAVPFGRQRASTKSKW